MATGESQRGSAYREYCHLVADDQRTTALTTLRLAFISSWNCLLLHDSATLNEALPQRPASSNLQSQGRLEVRSLVDNLRYGAEAPIVEDCPYDRDRQRLQPSKQNKDPPKIDWINKPSPRHLIDRISPDDPTHIVQGLLHGHFYR